MKRVLHWFFIRRTATAAELALFAGFGGAVASGGPWCVWLALAFCVGLIPSIWKA